MGDSQFAMAPTDKKKRLKSSMLQNFYVDAATKPAAADRMNLDAQGFDPPAYFEQLTKTKQLTDLMLTDRELKREIRKLDSNLKTLVYENYNKFISATDTIKKMQTNVSNMEAEMKRLSENMDKITSCTTQINKTLDPRRQRIDVLARAHRTFKKRQLLFELPSMLRRCIELGEYQQAVSYWTQCGPILREHLDLFRNVIVECEEVIKGLTSLLRTGITDVKKSWQETAEWLGYLIELGQPRKQLATEYIKVRGSMVEDKLRRLSAEDSTLVSGPVRTEEFIQKLNMGFLVELIDFSRTFQSAQTLQTVFERQEKSNETKKILEDFARELLAKYFHVVRSKLALCISSAEVIRSLEVAYANLMNMNSLLPDLNFQDRAADIVNSTITSQIDKESDKLQPNLAASLKEANATLTSLAANPAAGTGVRAVQDISNEICTKVVRDVDSFLNFVRPYFATVPHLFLNKYYEVFSTKLAVKLQQLFLFFNDKVCEASVLQLESKDTSAILLLVLSRVSLYLEKSGVPLVHAQLSEIISSQSMELINRDELIRLMKESTENLLWQYVKLQGQRLNAIVRAGVEPVDWMSEKEPREVRSAILLLMESLDAIEKEVEQIYPSQKFITGARETSHSKSSAEAVFVRKTRLSMSVLPERSAILSAVVKIALKSYSEYLRLKTLGKSSFQQVQVEVYFLRRALRNLVDDQGVLHGMADELLQSAMDRCLQPVLLDTKIVQKICEEAERSRQKEAPMSSVPAAAPHPEPLPIPINP